MINTQLLNHVCKILKADLYFDPSSFILSTHTEQICDSENRGMKCYFQEQKSLKLAHLYCPFGKQNILGKNSKLEYSYLISNCFLKKLTRVIS